MADVVAISENGVFKSIRWPYQPETAATFLASRIVTDAVFNNDIRAIQLVVNRIDGGLPKDVEVDGYQTRFGDCLNEVLACERADGVKLHPDDTVMMALCKSLYALATQNIYWDYERERPIKRPPTDRKQERDAAMRMILERVGGRRTMRPVAHEDDTLEDADWIKGLPSS